MPDLPRAGKEREWGCNMKLEVEYNKRLYTLVGFKQGQGGEIKTVSDPPIQPLALAEELK